MKLHHMLFCTKLWLVKIFAQERYNRYFQLKFRLDTNKPTFTQLLVMLERLRRYQIHGIRGKVDYVTVFFMRHKKPAIIENIIPWDSFLQLLHKNYTQGLEGRVAVILDRNMRVNLCPNPADSSEILVKVMSRTSDNNRLLYYAKRLSKLWPITVY